METAENVTLFCRFVDEVVIGGNVAAIDELLAPEIVEHEVLPPGFPPGREGVKRLFTLLHIGFPDLKADIEDVIAYEDKAVFRMTWHGTHTGQFLDIPPTGQRVDLEVIDIVRIADGKIVEHWGLTNQFSLFQQLGVIPAPGWTRSTPRLSGEAASA